MIRGAEVLELFTGDTGANSGMNARIYSRAKMGLSHISMEGSPETDTCKHGHCST